MSVVEVASRVWLARTQYVGWVLLADGAGVTLVDTGFPGDRERVIASLSQIGRSPADVDAVVLTHAHPDHVGNAEYFRSQEGKPVWVHKQEEAYATGKQDEKVTASAALEMLKMMWRPSILVWFVQSATSLKEGQVKRLGAVQTYTEEALDVPGQPVPVPTPGHTQGHAALHLPEKGVLLVGDALMTEHAIAKTEGPQLLPDFLNADPSQARASLERLRGLAADAVVPGHGPAFTGSPDEAVDLALRHQGAHLRS
jgi:glyoxylase-like metal-dependent hydrolase (beta-lactamase superfamily II)